MTLGNNLICFHVFSNTGAKTTCVKRNYMDPFYSQDILMLLKMTNISILHMEFTLFPQEHQILFVRYKLLRKVSSKTIIKIIEINVITVQSCKDFAAFWKNIGYYEICDVNYLATQGVFLKFSFLIQKLKPLISDSIN